MMKLIEYILNHTDRGECQCGKCVDKGEDREAPLHSINVHFFWVSKRGEPNAKDLLALLEEEYPQMDRLRGGPSYIEMGAAIGSQQYALLLIGLGGLVGLWDVITPEKLGVIGAPADELAGSGLVMSAGLKAQCYSRSKVL